MGPKMQNTRPRVYNGALLRAVHAGDSVAICITWGPRIFPDGEELQALGLPSLGLPLAGHRLPFHHHPWTP